MKNKFKMFMKFLSLFPCDNPSVRVQCDDDSLEYMEFYCGNNEKSIPSNMSDILEDIIIESGCIREIRESIYDEYDDQASTWFSFYIQFTKTTMEVFNADIVVYGTEDTGSYYSFDDYDESDSIYNTFLEIQKFLDEIKATGVQITYNGSGDSGYVESTYESNSGSGEVPENIDRICYDLLEDFGGWEINEGSQGTIEFTKDSIDINHQWNTEETEEFPVGIEITQDSFND